MRSGRLKSGELAVEQAMGKKQARLVILDQQASQATAERYENRCAQLGLRLLRMEDLGRCIGKPSRMVAAVIDDGFAKMICRVLDEDAGTQHQ